jgi:hypothetical protein
MTVERYGLRLLWYVVVRLLVLGITIVTYLVKFSSSELSSCGKGEWIVGGLTVGLAWVMHQVVDVHDSTSFIYLVLCGMY